MANGLSFLLSPLAIVLVLLLVGGGLVVTGWRSWGLVLGACGVLILGLASNEPFARALLLPLERQYEPLESPEALADVGWVVVLGSYASDASERPATTRLSGVAALRLMEGMRVHQAIEDSRLLLSGGTAFAGAPSATVMSRAALSLGVDPARMETQPGPGNTREEARALAERLGGESFVLVTSASHMPRAMALARKQGLEPIPAPTVWRTRGGRPTRLLLPTANALAMTERAIHEYLGLGWAWLRGEI
ncbi:ElyC/SanA/YdcF family protein [Gammaproteobacteria bacterium AB-CW1]|uniref:ElyC/SanA/YdcF family protein n=1 Tax=Natronospira elongata TaxID=3110268 RepID=A0AAP6MKQ3_9GAMM|nr:ElyC/SanA/YdcF family protein [Gammaproteobacteria bacterium AB-CW1]